MVSLFVTLFSLAAIAIPIAIVVMIVRRVKQVSERLGDPARLQRVFAQTAAAALRRAGADPQAVAKVELLGQGLAADRQGLAADRQGPAADRQGPAVDRAAELRAKAYEARIGLQRKGRYAASNPHPSPSAPVLPGLFEDEARPVPPAPLPTAPHPSAPLPRAEIGHALHRPSRPRARHQPVAPLGGIDTGDRFRLSEPPDISEPHGPMAFNGTWLAVAALLGGAAYYFLR